ncbi:MAG: RNA polymerase factor sigma-54 [Gammaproteobacteria bacterium]
MKTSLQLRTSQHLTMTPQLQQAIRLLQLSTLELQLEIQQALDSNMMLELDEGTEQEQPEQYTDIDKSPEEEEEAVAAPPEIPDYIPEELPVDSVWEDIYDGNIIGAQDSSNDIPAFENQRSEDGNLRNHLLWQLNLTQLGENDRLIALAIIDALDDDGYLATGTADIQESLKNDLEIEADEVEAVLHLVQAMDPPGVAARDLRECLLLQFAQCDPATPWLDQARDLVANHLQLLAAHDFNQLQRRLKVSQDDLQQIVALIQNMNPRPGAQIQETRTEYIVPDVCVRKERGVWKVELNTDAFPRLKINNGYASMIRRADNSADNVSLRNHLQEARWFIKSLQSRNETLLRVATCIVERQRAFLEYGDEAMKPLILHDIAETLGLHESTISRVTTRKYMHTPRGIFELKYFFSSHVATDQGHTCSSTAIRAFIKKFIGEESHRKPLSDNKIAGMLSRQGILVARRTIAKYREAMAIPPSNERKRLV